jgi:hypothetical protein
MYRQTYRQRLTGDLYNIVGRIKDIDPDYFVVYNVKICKFEIHNSNQKGDTLCVVLPYRELDARAVEYLHRTSVQRTDQLMQELTQSNDMLVKQENYQLSQNAQERFEEALYYNLES